MDKKRPFPYDYKTGYNVKTPTQIGVNFYCTKTIYTFYDCPNDGRKPNRYIVEIEKYEHKVCAIKFFRACDKEKGAIEKYRIKTQRGCAFRLMATLVQIALDLLSEDEERSFVFYGVSDKGEDKKETKRYRVYYRLVNNYVGAEIFERYVLKERSYVLLLNKRNKETNILTKIENMFRQGYPDEF